MLLSVSRRPIPVAALATTAALVATLATGCAGGPRLTNPLVKPDQAARDIDPNWFDEGDNIRVADAFVVDLMLNACGETYESLRQYAETIDLDGIPVHTINLQGLLLTKQTSRDKDIADRVVLERALAALDAGYWKP